MKDSDKELLAQKLEVIAEDIRRLPDQPMDIQINLVIQNLFEDVMCPLNDFKSGG